MPRGVSTKPKSVFNEKKDTAVRDRRISVCNFCNHGIFEGHSDYVYTNTGYVHIPCLESHEAENTA